jgi:hypothetical protein
MRNPAISFSSLIPQRTQNSFCSPRLRASTSLLTEMPIVHGTDTSLCLGVFLIPYLLHRAERLFSCRSRRLTRKTSSHPGTRYEVRHTGAGGSA